MDNKRTDECDRSMFTLDQPVRYQIKIAGKLADSWSDWLDRIDMRTETNDSGYVTTILTGNLDQAALVGILRRLYQLGFPIISVNCISSEKRRTSHDSNREKNKSDPLDG